MGQQHIHVASKSYRLPHAPSYVVLVMPEGAQRGEYYKVGSDTLKRLQAGDEPEELGLVPLGENDND